MYTSKASNPYKDYQLPSPIQQKTPSNVNPQSPRNNIESYYFTSQQPKNKKQFGLFSKRYLPKQAIPSANRSRITQQNMSMSGVSMLPEQKLYSQEMLFLLSEEQNNLIYFKQKVEGEKNRVNRDFDNVRRQIEHIISDLQSSFVAELDVVYKDFISRYGQFKHHMITLRQIRRNLLNEIPQDQGVYLSQLNQSRGAISNRDLLGEIEKDAQLFRTQKIYSQITDMQKENIVPARQIASELIVLGGIETQFYSETISADMLKTLVESIQREAKQAYPKIRDNFILSTAYLVGEKNDSNPNNVLNGLSEYQNRQDDYDDQNRYGFKSADSKDIIRNFQSPQKSILKPPETIIVTDRSDQQKRYTRPVSSSSDIHSGISKFSNNKDVNLSSQGRKSARNYHMGNLKNPGPQNFKVGIEQQNMTSSWIQDLSFREAGVIEAHHSTQALLCCIFACQGKVLVVGGKDRTLRVYQVSSGKLLYTLGGHQANICSLANHNQLVSSGGDHGCSTLILWDSRTWTVRTKVQIHSAAVTGIVDLQDSTHLATVSYDKKINIFNFRKGSVVLTASNSKTGIACVALSSDRQRIVTASLDNTVAVWLLSRDGTAVTNIQLERQFINNQLICSMRTLALKGNYFLVGTKDGRVQLINMLTGETLRKLSVGTAAVVELVLFERENKPDSPLILSCMPRQKSIVLTKIQTGTNSLVDLRGRLNVQIGCGIGPKVVLSESGLIAILSQSPLSKQILIYQVSLL